MKKITSILTFICLITFASAGTLFVGLEGSSPPTFSSDLSGFPNVNWTQHYSFDVSGAAATPEGLLYIGNGAFTTHLYEATLTSTPQQICTISEDMSSLAYGRNTLWGFSNYADPKGIYSINTNTGEATLALDVYTGYGFRFFALDYNPVDDLFYGYTEYGASGLYSINIDTGEMIQLTGSIPASNGQGRGMAVGNNTVYLTATRGDDGIPYFSYDISQGVGGDWIEFPNPYPAFHSTGGAAFIPDPVTTIELSGHVVGSDQPEVGLADCEVNLNGIGSYQTLTDANGDFLFPEVEQNDNYMLDISLEGYEIYAETVTVGIENIDLGTITLNETALPATNVVAVINEENTEVSLTWDAPATRELESYDVFRFLEINNQNPNEWELLASITETVYADAGWEQLEPEMYQYSIVAQYTNSIIAEAALSNVVEKLPLFNPPQNFAVDPISGLATWDPPIPSPGVTLIEYNVFLDGEIFTTTETQWQFENLINGQIYVAGIQVVYDLGVSDYFEIEFEYTGTGLNDIINSKTELKGNYPNPFNPITTISFEIANLNELSQIEIYNLKGQRIRQYSISNGQSSVIWNGTDYNDQPVSSGIYLYKLIVNGEAIAMKKCLLLK
ncbi:MAG: T9SS type A sorting domain-containing protein [Candidatus Cloacimonetes bacterium]|nr:T9SS type A sorting domain-containing protein [Candidatus Cloacimonadota bacterium]